MPRSAEKRVLTPAGNIERETILRIDHAGELNRRLAGNWGWGKGAPMSHDSQMRELSIMDLT